MIQNLATEIAMQMGIQLSEISFIDGLTVGCLDTYLLDLTSTHKSASTLVFQSELDDLQKNFHREHLEVKIRGTLARLQ